MLFSLTGAASKLRRNPKSCPPHRKPLQSRQFQFSQYRHNTPLRCRPRNTLGVFMAFLQGKKILITGLLSNRSIAYGIAQACKREGATLAFTYVNDDLHERVRKLAAEFGSAPVLRCDVTRDDDIAALFESLHGEWGGLDGLLHAI